MTNLADCRPFSKTWDQWQSLFQEALIVPFSQKLPLIRSTTRQWLLQLYRSLFLNGNGKRVLCWPGGLAYGRCFLILRRRIFRNSRTIRLTGAIFVKKNCFPSCLSRPACSELLMCSMDQILMMCLTTGQGLGRLANLPYAALSKRQG